jgi:hypothetical protein
MKPNLAQWITALSLISQSVSSALAGPVAQLVDVSGSVNVSSSKVAPRPISKGDAVDNGMTVTTGEKSKAVLRFQDGQLIALQSNSVFRVNEYKFSRSAPGKGQIFFSLLKGGLRAVTGLIGDRNGQNWKLETPSATAGIRGTDFLAVIYQGMYAQVTSGEISLTNSAGTEVFTAGQTAYVGSGAALPYSIRSSTAPDRIFNELRAIDLSDVDGAASSGAGDAVPTSRPMFGWRTGVTVAIGVGLAAAAAASGGGSSTTNH